MVAPGVPAPALLGGRVIPRTLSFALSGAVGVVLLLEQVVEGLLTRAGVVAVLLLAAVRGFFLTVTDEYVGFTGQEGGGDVGPQLRQGAFVAAGFHGAGDGVQVSPDLGGHVVGDPTDPQVADAIQGWVDVHATIFAGPLVTLFRRLRVHLQDLGLDMQPQQPGAEFQHLREDRLIHRDTIRWG